LESWRAGLLLILSLGLVAVGVGAAVLDPNARPAATAAILFFGACAAVFAGELAPKRIRRPSGDKPVLLYPDRRKAVVLTLGCAGLAASLPFLWRLGWGESVWGLGALGLMGLGAALGGGAAALRVIHPAAHYRFDAGGVSCLAPSSWQLAWADIEGFTLYRREGFGFLAVRLSRGAKRRMGLGAAAHEALGLPAYNIPAEAAGMDVQSLADLAEACMDHWSGEAPP
jgi:hypothetical protein